jgi:mannose-6-phosphate isomerase class I
LVNDPLFYVEVWKLDGPGEAALKPKKLQILAVTTGSVDVTANGITANLSAGQFCLIPASLEQIKVLPKSAAGLLRVEAD